jgi:catechol 2,3-dioxygenase-like lactoylglutathione lyase family enzyme
MTELALKGVHHTAFRCRDAEETRRFYEDVLGLPLKACVTGEQEPGSGKPAPFLHLFFELGDGNYVAFFDEPGRASEEKFKPKHGFDLHLALEAETLDALKAWQAKLNAADVPAFGPIDHHFCHSIYFTDPNGLALEITTRDARHDAIMAEEGANARAMIAGWSARKTREHASSAEPTAS